MFWQDGMQQQQREEADRRFYEYLREKSRQQQIEKQKREPKRHDKIRSRWGGVK
jgi:hypothetical protein